MAGDFMNEKLLIMRFQKKWAKFGVAGNFFLHLKGTDKVWKQKGANSKVKSNDST